MPGATIEVKTQRIFVNPPSGKIDIYGYGPPGPQGPPGPPGSGAAITWPVVAPANSTGNITFTPSTAVNDIRGLQTPDGASWMRFWGGPPGAIWIKSNSGPTTGGLNGQVYIDADRTDLRESAGVNYLASFTNTGHTFNQSLTVRSPTNAGAGNIYVGPTTGQTGDEGGQINFLGTSSWPTDLYIDRLQNMLRVIAAGKVIGGWYGNGYGFNLGTHPSHAADTYAVMWRPDRAGANDYAMIMDNGGKLYLNAASGQVIGLHNANAEVASVGVNFNIHGNRLLYFDAWGGGWYMQDTTWVRSYASKNVYTAGMLASDGGLSINNGGAVQGGYSIHFNGHTWVAGSNNINLASGQVANGRWVSGLYYEQAFYSNATASMAGFGWHPGGVAGSLRMAQNSARYHFNNTDSGGYYDVMAASYSVSSTLTKKTNVIDMPVGRPLDVVRQLRPIWFQTPTDLTEPMEIRDMENHANGPLEVRMLSHDCDTSPHCKGTSLNPCQRIRDFNRGRIGLGAEEVAALFPWAAVFDTEGNITGYDLPAIVALVIGAVRNLNDDQSDIISRLISLERKAVA